MLYARGTLRRFCFCVSKTGMPIVDFAFYKLYRVSCRVPPDQRTETVRSSDCCVGNFCVLRRFGNRDSRGPLSRGYNNPI